MFRQSSALRILALSFALALSAAVRGDDLLDYLEARGLDALAALRVEELAATASPDDRAQLLDRLAELFARLLDASNDPGTQARLLARADELAAGLSTAKGDGLRVSAARARYRDAARLAEGIRAGIAADPASALAVLEAQSALLLATADRAEKRATEADRRADRAQGIGRELILADVQAERSLAGQARYLAAWSMLYRSFLAADRGDAERAQQIFAGLLGGRDGKLTPKEVSEDLRSDEAFASAILGIALAKSTLDGFGEGARWLALLDSDDTFEGTRTALPGWTMVAALEARAFKAAREQFTKLASRDDAANWARVAVSRSVEYGASASGADAAEAASLLREALATLAARRDLGAIRDLVGRYGEGILGTDGTSFVPQYVRAVRLYDDAQLAIAEAGDDLSKQASDAVRDPSAAAADALGAALQAPDVANYEDAALACSLMRAWSLRGAGRFDEAAKMFDAVSAASLGERAETAARSAIACVDDARRATTATADRASRDKELIVRVEAFLARFPGSIHVPELLVRKVAASAEPSVSDVDQLLQVPRDSKDWLTSRRQALGALYRAVRGGKEPRAETGKRYLLVLADLPVDPKTKLPASNSTIARQALEVVLSSEVRDIQTAIGLLAALEAAGAEGTFDLREADEELAYRRLQIAILSDRWADAEAALAPFEKPEATALWADAGLRLAIRAAESKRRASAADAPMRGGYVATIVRAGDAIFLRAGGATAALAEGTPDANALVALARIALDARVELVASSNDAAQAAAGIPIVEALLLKSPRDAALLGSAAALYEATGDYARAADQLRALVGGLPARTNPWFAAKVSQMRVLAKLDPSRARTVIDQYRTLYPDLGPEPYRSQITAIDASLLKDGSQEVQSPSATGGST